METQVQVSYGDPFFIKGRLMQRRYETWRIGRQLFGRWTWVPWKTVVGREGHW